MVICNLSPELFNLEENDKHIATDWMVSDTLDFKNPILSSKDDKVNLINIIFQDDLDSTKKWYSKARIRTNKGWGVWGNVNIFNIKETISSVDMKDIPSKISTPMITTNSHKKEHDLTLFTATVTGFNVIGNSTHTATSWIIEDINANVIWSSLNDEVNKQSIVIDNILLKPNTVYRIKAMFHSSTNDTSAFGSLTIHTQKENDITLLTYLDMLDPSKENKIEVAPIVKDSLVFSIYGYKDNATSLIWKKETTDLSVVVPKNTLENDKCYILNITTDEKHYNTKNILFTTMK